MQYTAHMHMIGEANSKTETKSSIKWNVINCSNHHISSFKRFGLNRAYLTEKNKYSMFNFNCIKIMLCKKCTGSFLHGTMLRLTVL